MTGDVSRVDAMTCAAVAGSKVTLDLGERRGKGDAASSAAPPLEVVGEDDDLLVQRHKA